MIKEWLQETPQLKYKVKKLNKESDAPKTDEVFISKSDNLEKEIENDLEELKIELDEINEENIIREPAKFDVKDEDIINKKKVGGSTIVGKSSMINSNNLGNNSQIKRKQNHRNTYIGDVNIVNKFKGDKNTDLKPSPKKQSIIKK